MIIRHWMLYWFFWQMIICPNRYITLNNWIRKIIHTPTTWRLWLFAIVNSCWSIDVFFSFVKIWNRTEDRAPKTKTVIIMFLYEGIALSPEADPLIIISLCTYVFFFLYEVWNCIIQLNKIWKQFPEYCLEINLLTNSKE